MTSTRTFGSPGGVPAVPKEPKTQEAEPYVAQLQQHLQTIQQLAYENFARAQVAQKMRYDRGTQAQSFKPGDQVLVSRQTMAKPSGEPLIEMIKQYHSWIR